MHFHRATQRGDSSTLSAASRSRPPQAHWATSTPQLECRGAGLRALTLATCAFSGHH